MVAAPVRGPRVPAVFLDRDGVLIRSDVRGGRPYAVTRLEDLEILADVPAATRALDAAGFLLIVVTNQPDVGNGAQDAATVEAMHAELRRLLPIDDVEVCYHRDADRCDCRKPKPGMIFEAASRWGIDLRRSFVVGDRWRDVEAGKAAGCATIFVDRGYLEELSTRPDHVVADLAGAAEIILRSPETWETERKDEPNR